VEEVLSAADPVAEEEKEATPLPPPRKARTRIITTPLPLLVGCKTHTDDDDDDNDNEQIQNHTAVTCKQKQQQQQQQQLQQTQPASSAKRNSVISVSSECQSVVQQQHRAVTSQCNNQTSDQKHSLSLSKTRFFTVTMDDESLPTTASISEGGEEEQGGVTVKLTSADDKVGDGDEEIPTTDCSITNKDDDDIATVCNRPIIASTTQLSTRRPLSWMQPTSNSTNGSRM
jgi:hypothetical protein